MVAIDAVEIVAAACGEIEVERTGDGAETRKESSRDNNSSNPLRKRNKNKKIIDTQLLFAMSNKLPFPIYLYPSFGVLGFWGFGV